MFAYQHLRRIVDKNLPTQRFPEVPLPRTKYEPQGVAAHAGPADGTVPLNPAGPAMLWWCHWFSGVTPMNRCWTLVPDSPNNQPGSTVFVDSSDWHLPSFGHLTNRSGCPLAFCYSAAFQSIRIWVLLLAPCTPLVHPKPFLLLRVSSIADQGIFFSTAVVRNPPCQYPGKSGLPNAKVDEWEKWHSFFLYSWELSKFSKIMLIPNDCLMVIRKYVNCFRCSSCYYTYENMCNIKVFFKQLS